MRPTRLRRPVRCLPTARPRVEALEDRRLLAAGVLDTTFDLDGRVTTPVLTPAQDAASAVVYQPDGKLIVAGSASGSAHGEAVVARYKTDGTLDATFGSGGVARTSVGGSGAFFSPVDAAVLPDGDVVVLGNANTLLGNGIGIVRYNSNGSLDTGWGVGGVALTTFPFSVSPVSLEPLPSGQFYAAAKQGVAFSDGRFALVRFNADGSLDTTFDGDGYVDTNVAFQGYSADVVVQADGKPIVIGRSRQSSVAPTNTVDFTLVRYNTNGSLDNGSVTDTTPGDLFGVAGTQAGRVRTDFGGTFEIGLVGELLPGNKLRVFGTSNAGGVSNLAIAQYDLANAGALDTTFDGDGKLLTPLDPALVDVQMRVANGKLYVAGIKADDLAVQVFSLAGVPDAGFNGGAVATANLGGVEDGAGVQGRSAVAARADGSVAVVGSTDSNFGDFAVARFTSAGAVAGTNSLALLISTVEADTKQGGFVALQLDGKTVVAGTVDRFVPSPFGGFQTSGDLIVARYNANGSLDTSFGTGGIASIDLGGSEQAAGIAVDLLSGRIVVAASTRDDFFSFDTAVVRLNTNGLLDTSFDGDGKAILNLGDNEVVHGVGVDLFGRPIVAATTGFFGGRDVNVARLTSAGALDATYGVGGVRVVDFGTAELPTDDEGAGIVVDLFGRATVTASVPGEFGLRNVGVARLTSSGAFDPLFGTGGKQIVDFGTAEVPTDDVATAVTTDLFGRTVVAAIVNDDVAVARLNFFGALDSSFGTGGKTSVSFDNEFSFNRSASLGVDLIGRVHVGSTSGLFGERNMGVARLTTAGALDAAYGTSGIATVDFGGDDTLTSIAVDLFGRVVAGGGTFGADGPKLAAARLKGDII